MTQKDPKQKNVNKVQNQNSLQKTRITPLAEGPNPSFLKHLQ